MQLLDKVLLFVLFVVHCLILLQLCGKAANGTAVKMKWRTATFVVEELAWSFCNLFK